MTAAEANRAQAEIERTLKAMRDANATHVSTAEAIEAVASAVTRLLEMEKLATTSRHGSMRSS